MQEQLNRIESMLAELLKRTEPKTRPKKPIDTRTLEEQLAPFRRTHSPRELEKFLSYWSEGNRWKKEKTWEIKKRLERWKKQDDEWAYERSQKQQIKKIEETPKQVNSEIQNINTGFQKLDFNKFK